MISQMITSIVLAFLIAQGYKMVDHYRKKGVWDPSIALFQNGGMPSSHTSSSVALTTALFIETGVSYYMIIAAVFTIIVMNDAMKVRMQLGQEAKVLNQLMEKEHMVKKRLTEMVGHTPLQVLFGLLLGIVTTAIVYSF